MGNVLGLINFNSNLKSYQKIKFSVQDSRVVQGFRKKGCLENKQNLLRNHKLKPLPGTNKKFINYTNLHRNQLVFQQTFSI